ncbi:MAG: tetratricopeptide repeat protein [Chloroflexota bacterium]
MSDTLLIQSVLENGSELANRWRLQGQWHDANFLVQGLHPVATHQGNQAIAELCLLNGRILLDEAMFGGQDILSSCEEILNRAMDHTKTLENPALVGAIWDTKGFVLHATYLASDRSKELADELVYFERGLALRKEADDIHGIAESLFHIGLVYGVVRRDHVRALPYFEESYALAKETGDIVMTSYAIRHIAFAHHDAGEGESAYAAMAESLALREEAGFVPGVAMALHTMAYAESEYGDKTQAIACLERARTIFKSLGATKYMDMMATEIEQFQRA